MRSKLFLRFIGLFALFLLVPTSLLLSVEYEVNFESIGQTHPDLLNALKSQSLLLDPDLMSPLTKTSLTQKVEEELQHLAKVLQSRGFFAPRLYQKVDAHSIPMQVTISVDSGPLFSIGSVALLLAGRSQSLLPSTIEPSQIGLNLGSVALPEEIIRAEELIVQELSCYGYPFGRIESRKLSADVKEAKLHVTFVIDSGPLAYFGQTKVVGSKQVSPTFFSRKIQWKEGQLFDPCKLMTTQWAMEASALFSSIAITPGEQVDDNGALPITIEVTEAKQRSISFGVGYSTMRQFGFVGDCEHRNVWGQGERLALRSSLWWRSFSGTLFYLLPDWRRYQQDLISVTQLLHEVTEGYTESSFSSSVSLERQLTQRLKGSFGAMFKFLRNTRSNNDGNFNLVKFPLYLSYMAIDDPCDPRAGFQLKLYSTPSLQLLKQRFGYILNKFVWSGYRPDFLLNDSTLAAKVVVGSIAGARNREIPPSERFYAGSEEGLRGYRYLTVSPLNAKGDPVGGRSLLLCSGEWRLRYNETWGWVFFYDVGNVYSEPFIRLKEGVRQSVGCGLRYHTPVGPLRLDLAFPLNPRQGIDHRFQFYLTMGQSF